MTHVAISTQAFPYPMPMTLVSTEVDGRVNHMAVAWVTRVNFKPPLLAVALGKSHHTNRGLHEHREFGVSVPTAAMIRAVDHAGLVSGARADKSGLFEVFHGSLPHAPLVAGCPVAMACRLVQTVDLPTNELFIGEIIEAWAEEACLVDGVPDLERVAPYALTMPDNRYWAVGESLGKAWSIGRGYRGRE